MGSSMTDCRLPGSACRQRPGHDLTQNFHRYNTLSVYDSIIVFKQIDKIQIIFSLMVVFESRRLDPVENSR